MGIKICLAIVTNRQVKSQTVLSLANMLTQTNHEVYTVIATEGYTIAENRSYCLNRALREKCTHLLFIDDDMTFPPDTIEKLLSVEKPIVGVNSYSRKLPLTTTIGRLHPNGSYISPEDATPMPESPFECYSIGFGIALIDLEVIKRMKPPYFSFKAHPSGFTEEGEDGYFCRKARELEIEVWADPRIEVGHIGEFIYKKE